MSVKFDGKKKVTQNLKFKPQPDLNNLCLGYLEKVSVEFTDIAVVDDKGNPSNWEYAGEKVPRLLFEFKNVKRKKSDADRFYFHVESVITQTKKDGTPVDAKKVESMYSAMFDRIIHIHSAFEGTPNYKELDLEVEIDINADKSERVTQMGKFFKSIAAAFNKGKNDSPIYKSGEAPVQLYMKLLPDYQRGTRLEFPTFVGEGFIERYIEGVTPTIEIKPNETVELTGKKVSPSDAASGAVKSQDDLPDDLKEMINSLK